MQLSKMNRRASDIFLDGLDNENNKSQPLLSDFNSADSRVKETKHEHTIWQKFLLSMHIIQESAKKRKITLQGAVTPAIKQKNIVKNTKYNIITFIPVVLFNQFKYFFNLYFLLLAISQFFEILSVGMRLSYTAPLELILCLIMIKEAYDDYGRFKRDKEANSHEY